MSVVAALAPKKPIWFRNTAIAAAGALAVYLGLVWWRPWEPGRLWGLTFGTVAAALFVNAGLYPLRRRVGARPLGTVQRWLQLHIYGSVLATLFVFIHVGFRWPAGWLGWWLMGLTLWTTASGLLGVLLQKWLPVVISRNLKVEAIYERVPELVTRLEAEARTIMSEAGEALSRVYEAEIQPQLKQPAPRWGYLFDIRNPRTKLLEPLTRIETFVDGQDADRLRDLRSVFNEKLDLDVHLSLQRALRLWLYTHVPGAMLLLGLLVVHIFAVVYL